MSIPVFEFVRGNERLDWGILVSIDIDRLLLDPSVEALQRIVKNLAYAQIHRDEAAMFNPDHVVHLLRLYQVIVQYVIYSQDCLAKLNSGFSDRCEEAQKRIKELEEQLCYSNREREELKKMLAGFTDQKKSGVRAADCAADVGSAARTPHKCPLCGEQYHKLESLQSHLRKRHAVASSEAPTPLCSRNGREKNNGTSDDINELRGRVQELERQLDQERRTISEKMLRDQQYLMMLLLQGRNSVPLVGGPDCIPGISGDLPGTQPQQPSPQASSLTGLPIGKENAATAVTALPPPPSSLLLPNAPASTPGSVPVAQSTATVVSPPMPAAPLPTSLPPPSSPSPAAPSAIAPMVSVQPLHPGPEVPPPTPETVPPTIAPVPAATAEKDNRQAWAASLQPPSITTNVPAPLPSTVSNPPFSPNHIAAIPVVPDAAALPNAVSPPVNQLQKNVGSEVDTLRNELAMLREQMKNTLPSPPANPSPPVPAAALPDPSVVTAVPAVSPVIPTPVSMAPPKPNPAQEAENLLKYGPPGPSFVPVKRASSPQVKPAQPAWLTSSSTKSSTVSILATPNPQLTPGPPKVTNAPPAASSVPVDVPAPPRVPTSGPPGIPVSVPAPSIAAPPPKRVESSPTVPSVSPVGPVVPQVAAPLPIKPVAAPQSVVVASWDAPVPSSISPPPPNAPVVPQPALQSAHPQQKNTITPVPQVTPVAPAGTVSSVMPFSVAPKPVVPQVTNAGVKKFVIGKSDSSYSYSYSYSDEEE